jgi:hypothetical protein
VIWPFCTTLSAILCSIFSTLKTGVLLFSTIKPFTYLSVTSRLAVVVVAAAGFRSRPILETPKQIFEIA